MSVSTNQHLRSRTEIVSADCPMWMGGDFLGTLRLEWAICASSEQLFLRVVFTTVVK